MRARTVVLLLVAVLGFYLYVLGDRAVLLIAQRTPVSIGLGLAVLVLPLLGVVLVAGELRFGQATERLGRRLAAAGELPAETDLVRTAGGRVDRAAADGVFQVRRAEVEATPGDWRAWYRLGLAYGDAGDTARGRRAMRRAIALERAERSGEVHPQV